MEDLALIVSLMILAELLFALAVITFSIIYRVNGKFAITSLVLIGILAVETVWALSILPQFGTPPLIGLVICCLLRFLPRKNRKKTQAGFSE